AVADPPLKLVLIAGSGEPGTLNHLGVEVESADQVGAAARRLAAANLETRSEDGVDCCYAIQDKVWVTGPGGERWEVYTVLADSPPTGEHVEGARVGAPTPAGDTLGCCG